jgi:tRNA pseudouridine55 synthase
MNGILSILKPPGMTSHDVVAFVRGLSGAKAGHAGTLDPAAAGVLVVGVGSGTRLLEFLTGADKTYRAEITLGLTTDTQDAEGEVLSERDASEITEADVREALVRLTGRIFMVPPMYSAIKQDGRKLYELARKGETVAREPREAHIRSLELRQFDPGHRATAVVDVACSSGTYVRSLAETLGENLGCGGCLTFLLRTSVGPYRLADAVALEELRAAMKGGDAGGYLQSGTEALADMPAVTVDGPVALRLSQGCSQRLDYSPATGTVRVMTPDGKLLCIAEVQAEAGAYTVRPRKVFTEAV